VREKMSFREIWNGPSFLERGVSAMRMKARDEAGKKTKNNKKHIIHEHFNKEWDKDLWD
tara:strand:+ start:222 stop:398 length:177 start_codon:yes stop_codon:yes gene_type:complete